ncbi:MULTISPECIES: hypothetical protein [unclassified Nostoc]|uniref:hypothetical protein n=1 Tax=unclassified Nostoc TaxID=2593658 RepID=UPI002AD5A0A1|nr:hypothetical protein [Nostoc sp. DedQUE03]MDZ7974029.1 hypothetical protein [Nostoc sp. DedQUE03]MDZ8048530.1 hypothetical protein [Nostoc sp. DedQUE02]
MLANWNLIASSKVIYNSTKINSSVVQSGNISTFGQVIPQSSQLSTISNTIKGLKNSQGLLNFGNIQARGILFTEKPLIAPNIFKALFGANAVQTATTLTIKKSDIPLLTPSNNNTAESLLVGLLSIVLNNKLVIEFNELTFTYQGYGKTEGKRIDTITIDIRNSLTPTNKYELPEINAVINPNNY